MKHVQFYHFEFEKNNVWKELAENNLNPKQTESLINMDNKNKSVKY